MEQSLAELTALLFFSLLLGCHSLLYRSAPRTAAQRNWQRATRIWALGVVAAAPLSLLFWLRGDHPLLLLCAHQLLGYGCGCMLIETAWLASARSGSRFDWRPHLRWLLLLGLGLWAGWLQPEYRDLALAIAATAIFIGLGLRAHQRLFLKPAPSRGWLALLRGKLSGYAYAMVFIGAAYYLVHAWTVVPITSGQLDWLEGAIAVVLGFAAVEVAALTVEQFLLRSRRRSAELSQLASDGIRAMFYLALAGAVLQATTRRDLSSLALSSAFFSLGLGFALKPTLGNFVAGLVLRSSRDFDIGDFLQVGSTFGLVTHIDWRSLKLGTLQFDDISIPHSQVARSVLVNHSRPSPQHACYLDMRLPLEHPPAWIRQQILDIAEHIPEVARFPGAEVYLMDFRDGCCHYRLRWWLEDIVDRPLFDAAVRRQLSYGLERRGLRLVVPIRQWEFPVSIPETDA